jgi:hypothetical protein
VHNPDLSRQDASAPLTAGEALARYLHAQAGDFLRSLRMHSESGADTAGVAEAARALRQASRRISGTLHTFRGLLDPAWADDLRTELAWLSATLAQEHACTSRLSRLLDALSRLSGATPLPPARGALRASGGDEAGAPARASDQGSPGGSRGPADSGGPGGSGGLGDAGSPGMLGGPGDLGDADSTGGTDSPAGTGMLGGSDSSGGPGSRGGVGDSRGPGDLDADSPAGTGGSGGSHDHPGVPTTPISSAEVRRATGTLTVGAARAGALLERQLTLARTRAHSAALQALGSSRFHAVADAVAVLASELPLGAVATAPAAEALALPAEITERRLLEAVATLPLGRAAHPYNAEALVNGLATASAGEAQDAPWHQVRLLLRLHRYAQEVLHPDGDPVLCRAGLVLDRHRDAAEAATAAATAARTPRIAPATAYALGVLHADQRHEVEAARFAFQQVWQRTAVVTTP